MILLAALLAGASAPATAAAPLAGRVADVATRFCVDLLSGAVAVPAVGGEETRVFGSYGLQPGIPPAAMRALGAAGTTLIAGATLASGEAADGAFLVALGGRAGPTCRVIVYRAPIGGLFVRQVDATMKAAPENWKAMPDPVRSSVALRLTLLKRDAAGRPFLANLIAPVTPGPVVLVANVAAVPATVTLPQGF